MVGAMDWNDLSSRSIPSVGAAGGGGAGSARSMAALQMASQALLDQTGAAPRLSTRRWAGAASTRDTPAGASTTTPRGSGIAGRPSFLGGSITDSVSQYEESILERIRQQPDEMIRERSNQVIVDYLQNSWEKKHNAWLDELGIGGLSNTGGGGGDGYKFSGRASAGPLSPRSSGASRSSSSRPHYGGDGVRGYGSAWPQSHPHMGVETPLDPKLIHAHLSVVKDLPRLEWDEAARQFGTLSVSSQSAAVASSHQRGYAIAWKFVEHLLTCQQQQGSSPPRAALGSQKSMDAIDQAMATLHHLSVQYYADVERIVQSALQAGQADLLQDTYNHHIAIHCEAYTKLLFGGPQALETPWAVLYYCLRCGSGSKAALDVWQTSKSQCYEISDAVADSITRLLVALPSWGEQQSLSSYMSASAARTSDRHIVADYLASLQTIPGSEHGDPADASVTQPSVHQVGVLSLLCGAGEFPVDSNVQGFGTIEDYLFGLISRALLQRDPQTELELLGQSIQSRGPAYFGAAESGGWSFSLPLLITQQYSRALTNLVEFGSNLGLLQATHLGLILSSASVELEDLGQPGASAADQDLAASLLVEYSNRLLTEPSAGSLAALEYLSLIPKRERMRKEVASLIAKTGNFSMAGKIDENGVRHGGEALELRFSEQELAAILGEAAEMLLRQNGDNQKLGTAAMCYMLAGRYDSVLRLLNDMISPPNGPMNQARQFWIEQTKQFHQYYLEKRTRVVDVLEQEGKLNLVQTSRYMIELNLFFQQLNAGQYYHAWNIASRTDLLPKDRNNVAVKQDRYRTELDDSIKRCFPALLVGVMQCLHQMHYETKKMSRDPVASQRLRELQEYARILVIFAGLLGVASDDLSKMEAMMV